MTKLSNIINRQRMFVGGELGNDTADLLEEQAREIDELKADATERNADHGKLVEENHELRAELASLQLEKTMRQAGERSNIRLHKENKELRAALVEAVDALERCTKYTDADYAALTRCKEVLK